ncbi:MAG: hypothetical protein ACI9MC_001571, partial [Kiritimatiellia bacterium]
GGGGYKGDTCSEERVFEQGGALFVAEDFEHRRNSLNWMERETVI